jgi:tRNA uridine 5-carboxymethylaminomethyl modification enzyme
MFTSRAEYRLTLRADNADQRLTGKGIAIGCVGAARSAAFESKKAALDDARRLAQSVSITPSQGDRHGLSLNKDGQRRSAMDILAYPGLGFADVIRVWPELGAVRPEIAQQLEVDAKYAVYLDRQAADVAAYRRDEALELPETLDFSQMTALSMEVRQKLQSIRESVTCAPSPTRPNSPPIAPRPTRQIGISFHVKPGSGSTASWRFFLSGSAWSI